MQNTKNYSINLSDSHSRYFHHKHFFKFLENLYQLISYSKFIKCWGKISEIHFLRQNGRNIIIRYNWASLRKWRMAVDGQPKTTNPVMSNWKGELRKRYGCIRSTDLNRTPRRHRRHRSRAGIQVNGPAYPDSQYQGERVGA